MDREEAIERIKTRFDKWALDNEDMKAIQTVIPGLIESEDERMRNWIISVVMTDKKLTAEQKERMKAYLEKQKEQKPVTIVRIPKFRVGDIIQHVPLEKWDSSKNITSIDEHGYNFNLSHLGDTVSGGAIGFAFEDEYELVEQKPAEWSEEDEKFFKTALWHISYSVSNGKTTDCRCDTTEWLKGVKERLKSLLPQPHWRPSEEQMEMLSYVVEGRSDLCGDVLRSLYQDLKKLM